MHILGSISIIFFSWKSEYTEKKKKKSDIDGVIPCSVISQGFFDCEHKACEGSYITSWHGGLAKLSARVYKALTI